MPQVTIEQAVQLALQHQRAGQLGAAEEIYRQVLALQPGQTVVWHLLGVLMYQKGDHQAALEAIRRALALHPNYAEAYSTLGIVLKAAGRLDEALVAYRQALTLAPACAAFHYNLGNALKDKGAFAEAVNAYRQALALQPNYPEAHYNLGLAWQALGRPDEELAAYRQAVALRPTYAEAHNNLGVALKERGQIDEALAAYRQALALRPNYPEAHSNLGNALKEVGRLDEALGAYRQALALQPDLAEVVNNVGLVLECQGQRDDAIAAYRQALAFRPGYLDAWNNLGNALRAKGQLDEALAAYPQAAAVDPHFPEVINNAGKVLKDKGQLDEALAAHRQALALQSSFVAAYDNLVYALHFHEDCDARTLYEEHRRWNERYAEPLTRLAQPHTNDRSPNRRLRIGYVSPDFRWHPVGRFLQPLLEAHDHERFEIFCYFTVARPDHLTEQLRPHADCWRAVGGAADEDLARLIRTDRIDVLVDLTMHMANNRLLVFARKPAPVQVTYLAYCATTGVRAIDYRLTDPFLDPPEQPQPWYSEQSIWLPRTYWCYRPRAELPPVSALPALEAGRVTFGCLNNFCKATPCTLTAWRELLRQVSGSRLLLHTHQGSHRDRVRAFFAEGGVAPERVDFVGLLPFPKYCALHGQIDLALDPFPYGGGTTTCDALWMGVRVLSLAGPLAVSRGGLSILSNVGLPDLVAQGPEEYVRLAAELAADLSRLAELRAGLRARMAASPLLDAPGFARQVEAAFRSMWQRWCLQPDAAAAHSVPVQVS